VIDSILAEPETRHARWGILIVDPDRGDTLYSHDAGKLFVPASNMKLVTGAIALDVLGPDFQFATPVLAAGPVQSDGTLTGDLVVVGRGDPSISDHMAGDAMIPLQTIAEAVAAHGILRIRGSIRAAGDAFPDANLGFGWSWDDLEYAYSAPMDELLFNEGFSTVHVHAGTEPGDTLRVWTAPARTYPPVRTEVLTAARDTTADTSMTRIEVVKDTVSGDVIVSGTVLPGDSVTRVVTHRDPSVAFVAALREALIDRGIVILDSASAADSAALDTVFVLRSPPVSQILGFFMKPSQNQVGEMLFKSVALQLTDTGTARVARRVFGERLRAWGADSSGFAVWDGSGLTRRDLLSPETIAVVLDTMRRSRHFQEFYDALPVAGVDGTLRQRMRGTVGEGNVRAKTGTLGGVRSLSGYVTTADGQQLLFIVLANNYMVGTDYVSRVQDTIAVRLARLRGIPPARAGMIVPGSGQR